MFNSMPRGLESTIFEILLIGWIDVPKIVKTEKYSAYFGKMSVNF